MVDMKITGLPVAAAALRPMVVEVADEGVSRQLTLENIVRLVAGVTNGFLARTALGVITSRTLTATAPLTVTNGDGVAGDPAIAATLATTPQAVAGTGVGLMNAPLVKAAIDARLGSGGGWSAYDGGTGIFYDYAINGVQAFVDTPDFEDGYEYRILMQDLKGAVASTNKNLRCALYRQETTDYTPSVAVIATGGVLTNAAAVIDLDMYVATPRILRQAHGWVAEHPSTYTGPGGYFGWGELLPGREHYRQSAPYRVLRIRFNWSTGNVGGGTMRLLRQPVAI